MGKGNKRNKFKRDTNTQSERFNYNPKTEIPVQHFNHPIFCFKHLHPEFNIERLSDEEKVALITQIGKLSQLDWQKIEYSHRHGLGTEKIHLHSIKPNCPSFITDDVEYLLAFRFYEKMPFLVHRDKFLAHIIFIDPKGKVYDH
jgi:hypothetical protein